MMRIRVGLLLPPVLLLIMGRFAIGAETVRLSVVSQVWSDEGRTLKAVQTKLDEAATERPDFVLLPQECVATEGESIPGPISEALGQKARQHRMYLVGNLRERDGKNIFVTSFLLDRQGKLVGKYRKSHKMPDEVLDLGDELPVFPTEFGPVAMRIGTDRFFPEIDMVYAAREARMILWSQMPEPVEDEHLQDFPSLGRAVDLQVVIACARYAYRGPGWITNMYPPYCGCPIGRSYVINQEGQRIASTPRTGGVATAVIPKSSLAPGRSPVRMKGFVPITAPATLPPTRTWAKRKVRLTAIEAHLVIEELLARLDEAGRMGTDIACTYELVWMGGSDPKQIAADTVTAKKNLLRVAEKARQHRMYVLIAGVVDRIERNEAILFGRDGREVGRYFKIAKTHDQMIPGDAAPILETDFGRIGVRICADEWMMELDRCYAVQGADIVFTPTQSWGPDALFRDLRDISRTMDGLYYLVECTHPSTEAMHRSLIVDPAGAVIARSEYRKPSLLTAVIDLDAGRPLRYLRSYDPYKPGGYLPEYQPDRMPRSADDLRQTVLQCRRPSLYGALGPQP
jgi:predicted amidohydrolase